MRGLVARGHYLRAVVLSLTFVLFIFVVGGGAPGGRECRACRGGGGPMEKRRKLQRKGGGPGGFQEGGGGGGGGGRTLRVGLELRRHNGSTRGRHQGCNWWRYVIIIPSPYQIGFAFSSSA